MKRQTSLEAFKKIRDNGLLKGLRFKVYSILFASGPMTASEVAKLIPDHRINSINPRFAELARLKVITITGERICEVTKMTALEWDVTDSLPVKDDKTAKPKSKIEMLRKHNEEMKKEIARLETIVQNQQRKLNKWGRPTKAEQAERRDTSLQLPI